MQEAHLTEAAVGSLTNDPEPRRVLLRVVIESKLELGPSDHRSSKPWAEAQAMPGKRARTRRHGH
jgi:hypothetical protein